MNQLHVVKGKNQRQQQEMHQTELDEVTAQIHKLEQDSQRVLVRLEKELPEKFSQVDGRISNCLDDRKR